ncbi:MAG: NmrA family NAD(P)-binding protein [Dokdonella sp.]
MYAITGVTGKVGGSVAKILLAAGVRVRAVVRDAAKAAPWSALGADIAIASSDDAAAMTKAFEGADGVFLMNPPNFDPQHDFPDSRASAAAFKHAIEQAQPGRVVLLSTIGAHVQEPNLLNNMLIVETALRTSSTPMAFLRAGWFMENAAWDVEPARSGVIPSFLQPLDHAIPMVATVDIARAAADLLREQWNGVRIVELEGPRRYSANDISAAFAAALGHPVRTNAVPRDTWESLFRSQGMRNPLPRIRMVDGFNEGWIDFEGGAAEHRTGPTSLDTVLQRLVAV